MTAPSAPESSSSDDTSSSVAELRKLVADFVAQRDWSQFHAPKNISMALAIEAAELMEHFQWISPEASREIPHDPDTLAALRLACDEGRRGRSVST